MKKNIIIIAIALLLIGIGTFFLYATNNPSYSNIKVLSIDELKEKINNEDSFILIFTQDGCTHCKAFIPVANKVGQKYNITFYDFSITNISEENKAYLKNVAFATATPTTVFIENGKEKSTLNRLEGNVQEYKLVDKLKATGYINEE